MSNMARGIPLPPSSKILYSPSGDSIQQQPRATPIAHFPSTPQIHPTGSLLDVNASYIVYAVKNGLVRVIDRRSALRTLLRGHNKLVTDVAFFGNDVGGGGPGGTSDVLGTVGGEGDTSGVLIWRIFDREKELASEKLLEIRYGAACRMVWHVFNPNQFLLLHRKTEGGGSTGGACATLVESTRIATVPSEEDSHAVCLCRPSDDATGERAGTTIEGALQLHVPTSSSHLAGCNDLTWSNMDARHVLTAHDDGMVRLWDLRGRMYVKDGKEMDDGSTTGDVSARCVLALPVVDDDGMKSDNEECRAVTRCVFLSKYDDSTSVTGDATAQTSLEPGSYLTAPFVTGTGNNTTVTLWSPFSTTGSPPTKVRIFVFEQPQPQSMDLKLNLALCSALTAQNAPPESYLLLSDRNEGNLYALHVQSQFRSHVDSQQHSTQITVASGFDYLVEFKVVHPIYSWTVTSNVVRGGDDEEDGEIGGLEVGLFCVQSKAVQVLSLTPGMLAAPTPLGTMDSLPPGVRVEEPSAPAAAVVSDGEFEVEDYDVDGEKQVQEEEMQEEEVQYDDYDDEEEGMGDNVGEKEDEEDEEDRSDTSAPPASALPPPGLSPPQTDATGAPAAAATPSSSDPFANWLGTIAASTPTQLPPSAPVGVGTPGPPPIPPPPPPTPATSTSSSVVAPPPGLQPSFLNSLPFPGVPNGGAAATKTTPAPPPGVPISPPPGVAPPPPSDKQPKKNQTRQGSPFLSPMELLDKTKKTSPAGAPLVADGGSSSVETKGAGNRSQQTHSKAAIVDARALDKAVGTLPATPTESKSEGTKKSETKTKNKPRSRQNTPKRDGRGGSGGGGKGGPPPGSANKRMTKMGTPVVPIPAPDGKIAILKREDDAAKADAADQQQQQTPSPRSPHPPPAASAAASSPVSTAAVEDVVRRTLSSHFKKHESLVLAEIQKTAREEMQNSVLPAFTRTVEETMEQKVTKPVQTSLNKSSKESTKVRTKEVVDAVSESVRGPVVDAFNESMRSVMVPAYEAATRQMFAQVSASLASGLSAEKARDEKAANLMESMSTKMDAMAKAIESLTAEVTQLRSAVDASNAASSAASVASHQPPPAQPVDPTQAIRDEVLALLKQKQYEQAFTKALSASTAEMAVFACKNTDVTDVFGAGPTPTLSQPILLCLMQQLGAVLVSSNETDLRTELAWLQEIALTLDPNNDSIRRHVSGVLQQLVMNINSKMAEGDPALRRPLQMLLQVIRGIGSV